MYHQVHHQKLSTCPQGTIMFRNILTIVVIANRALTDWSYSGYKLCYMRRRDRIFMYTYTNLKGQPSGLEKVNCQLIT